MDNTANDIASAPDPTARTLAMRANPLYQFWRFIALNLRFLTMITKGGH